MYGGRTRLEALLERGVAEHLRRLDQLAQKLGARGGIGDDIDG